MKISFIKPIVEGIAFLIIIIFLFNEFVQFLTILGLFSSDDIRYIGLISVLLAFDNMLSKTFFGFRFIT